MNRSPMTGVIYARLLGIPIVCHVLKSNQSIFTLWLSIISLSESPLWSIWLVRWGWGSTGPVRYSMLEIVVGGHFCLPNRRKTM